MAKLLRIPSIKVFLVVSHSKVQIKVSVKSTEQRFCLILLMFVNLEPLSAHVLTTVSECVI